MEARRSDSLITDIVCEIQPKFHYTDFPVRSATSPRQTRDAPFSPNSITPTFPKLPRTGKFRGSRRNGIWVKGGVTGLSQTSRESRHSGIWAYTLALTNELRPSLCAFVVSAC